jgi:hypothetical protein
MWNYLSRLWSAFSQFLNVLLLNGHPNESISGRCYREPWPRAERVVNLLFRWQSSSHCKSAFMSDLRWAKSYIDESARKDLE